MESEKHENLETLGAPDWTTQIRGLSSTGSSRCLIGEEHMAQLPIYL